MTTLDRKVAIVTGAGSGVGREVALALGREGVLVGLVGRTGATLDETARLMDTRGGRAVVLPANVANESRMQSAVAQTVAKFGGVDILVCAAAVGLYGPVEHYSLANWRETLDTNLTGVFLACKAVIPLMRARGGGSIVAIGSGAGKQGYADLAAYSASKFGLIGFMESLAAEVGSDRIKVSTVLPGSILTGFSGRSVEEKERQRDDGRKYLEVADVAEAIVFLLRQSDRAWTQELNLWPF